MTRMTRVTGIAIAAVAAMATTAAAAPVRTGVPGIECTAAAAPQTGTFRAVLRGTDGSVMPALITIERLDGCLGVLVVMDSPTALEIVSVSDNELIGKMRTTTGYAQVTLKLTADAVSGTVVEGKKIWAVDGKRSS